MKYYLYFIHTKRNSNHTNLNQSKLSFSLFNHMSSISTILNLQNKQVILVLNNIFNHTINVNPLNNTIPYFKCKHDVDVYTQSHNALFF